MGLCLAYQLADRGGDGFPSRKKGPSVFRCLPHFTENRDDEGPGSPSPNVLRPTDYLISKVYADKSTLAGC